jgi:predicted transcriptional regulator
VRLDAKLYRALVHKAVRENRTVSNLIETAVRRYVEAEKLS